jgi:hypothetical protein
VFAIGAALVPAGGAVAQTSQQYVTAGASGVTIVPSSASPVDCGDGFALSGASVAGNAFPMSTGGGTIQTAIGDGTITAGDLVTVGSSTAGHVADLGVSSRASVSPAECIVGAALTGTGSGGGLITVLYDGPGSFGTANINTNSSAFTVGDLIQASGANSTADSGIVATNVNANSSAFITGDLVQASGSHSTSDSSVVAANVNANSSAFATGDLVQASGSHSTSDASIVAANVNANSSAFTTGDLVQAGGSHATSDSGIATSAVWQNLYAVAPSTIDMICAVAADTVNCDNSVTNATTAYAFATTFGRPASFFRSTKQLKLTINFAYTSSSTSSTNWTFTLNWGGTVTTGSNKSGGTISGGTALYTSAPLGPSATAYTAAGAQAQWCTFASSTTAASTTAVIEIPGGAAAAMRNTLSPATALATTGTNLYLVVTATNTQAGNNLQILSYSLDAVN